MGVYLQRFGQRLLAAAERFMVGKPRPGVSLIEVVEMAFGTSSINPPDGVSVTALADFLEKLADEAGEGRLHVWGSEVYLPLMIVSRLQPIDPTYWVDHGICLESACETHVGKTRDALFGKHQTYHHLHFDRIEATQFVKRRVQESERAVEEKA